MIDQDWYNYDPRHENLADVSDQALLGKPVPLHNVRAQDGIVTADPVEFEAITGRVPDYLLMFLVSGELIVLLDQLNWSERKIDGRKLAIKWDSIGIFSI
jgi:hypothetical protein